MWSMMRAISNHAFKNQMDGALCHRFLLTIITLGGSDDLHALDAEGKLDAF